MRNELRTAAAAAAVLGLVVGVASLGAASATANLAASSSVANNCTISTAALAFGAYDPVVANASANLDASGTVSIACTKGATATIDLDLGANATGSTRRLSDGAGTPSYLTYEIYSDAGRTTVWGAGASGLAPAAAPSKAARNFTAYGRVPSNQDVPAGSYADTVVATVNF
jgi:spore coat protein U-like protein